MRFYYVIAFLFFLLAILNATRDNVLEAFINAGLGLAALIAGSEIEKKKGDNDDTI